MLKRRDDDFSRQNILHQATDLQYVVVCPPLLTGITLNTSLTNYQPIKQLREIRCSVPTSEGRASSACELFSQRLTVAS